MTASWQSTARALVGDLQYVFGDRLRSVVAYGPHIEGRTDAPLSCLALVRSMTVEDLDACARRTRHWHRSGVATPLVVPEAEFHASLDAFPLEYGEIIRAHERVHGVDPFEGVAIVPADLRRACETQIKSHLLHLREGYLESGGEPDATGRLVAASAPAFAALLRHVAWLSGATTGERGEATRAGAAAAGLPPDLVADMIALDTPSAVPPADPARLFPRYVAAVEQLARAVDAWRV